MSQRRCCGSNAIGSKLFLFVIDLQRCQAPVALFTVICSSSQVAFGPSSCITTHLWDAFSLERAFPLSAPSPLACDVFVSATHRSRPTRSAISGAHSISSSLRVALPLIRPSWHRTLQPLLPAKTILIRHWRCYYRGPLLVFWLYSDHPISTPCQNNASSWTWTSP